MGVLRPGDFIKTSTGKTSLNATLANNQVMIEAIRDFYLDTGDRDRDEAGGRDQGRRSSRSST